MTLASDDPRLTAYALGDLDEAERAELERELEGAPELRDEIEAIRRLAGHLGAALRAEPAPEFGAVVVTAAPVADRTSAGNRRRLLVGLALAASILLIVGVLNSPRLAGRREPIARQTVSPAPQSGSTQIPGDVLPPKIDPKLLEALREIPADEEPPLVYPDAATWDQLILRRESTAPASNQPETPNLNAGGTPASESTWETKTKELGYPAEPVSPVQPIAPSDPNQGTQITAGSNGTPSRVPGLMRRGGGGMGKGGGPPPVASGYQVQDDAGYVPLAGYRDPRELSDRDRGESATVGRSSPDLYDGDFATRNLDESDDSRRAGREFGFDNPKKWRELTERRSGLGTEAYDTIVENPFRRVSDDPLSTFSIDVDTASYANVRRFLEQHTLPPRSAVRIEELVNYFSYDYPQPEGEDPFAVHLEVAGCPWEPAHRLVRVALKGREIDAERRPPSNLVFLVDVSGSMADENKLPLVKQGLRMLTERMREDDRVAIVTYAGNSGVALPSTGGQQKSTILAAIDALHSGGSTNGASGIELAYALAVGHFIKGGTNRVILCTDGDFNVGVTDRGALTKLIEQKAASGVFLSVLGFGMGNLKDNTLETLADKGNGVYAYIDSEREARKVLVEELSGTLVTIAKDVKLQLEFNPGRVAGYRLLGYENRVLAHQDFNDDRKDAGDIGAGHTVTAFYEIIPVGGEAPVPGVDPLKYQQPAESSPEKKATDVAPASDELLTVKLRYKQPDGQTSKLLEAPLQDAGQSFASASREFRFASAVVEFGLLLRDSAYRGGSSFEHVTAEAEANLGKDAEGYRREFLRLVREASDLRN